MAGALALHAPLFLWPTAKTEAPEKKEFQRGLKAKVFRPAPPPVVENRPVPAPPAAPPRPQQQERPPAPPAAPNIAKSTPPPNAPAGEPGRPAAPAERPAEAPRASVEGARPAAGPSGPAAPAQGPAVQDSGVRRGPPTQAAGTAPAGAGAPAGQGKGRTGKGADEWSSVLSDLSNRGQTLAARVEGQGGSGGGSGRGTGGGGGRGRSGGGRGGGTGQDEDEGGYLDPRIRVNVISYPPSSLDSSHPGIPYPDLKFHKKDLKAGTCRVYYRVYVDGSGQVTRGQIKAPESAEEQKRYAPFIDAVVENAKKWRFDRQAGEVHIDVLFTIE